MINRRQKDFNEDDNDDNESESGDGDSDFETDRRDESKSVRLRRNQPLRKVRLVRKGEELDEEDFF